MYRYLTLCYPLYSERGGEPSLHRPQRAGDALGSRPPQRRLPRQPGRHGHWRHSAAAHVFIALAATTAAAAPQRGGDARTRASGPAFCQR